MLIRRSRSVVTNLVVLLTVFAAGAAVGFVLEHEPAPDDRRITIHSPPQTPPAETFIAGEVTAIDGGRIELRAPGGLTALDIAPDAAFEALRRADASRFQPGDAVNVGGEQGDFGLVLTGVVALEAASGAEASR